MTAPDPTYDAAIAYATTEGTAAGTNAAGWYVQETIGGRVTRGADDAARRILRGIEDGDPAVLDTLPYADLSGQWADTLTGPELVNASILAAGDDTLRAGMTTYDDICNAYETAYSIAAESAIAAAARDVLA